MDSTRLITGFSLSIIGVVLLVFSFFSNWSVSIYGVLIFILGVFILLNKKENEIEQRKDLK